MNSKIAYNICSILGLCKKTKFPGTLASIVASIFSFSVYYFFNKNIYILLFFIFLILAFWSINKIQKEQGIKDYQWIGIDEWLGVWIANIFLFEFNFTKNEAIIFTILSFIIFRIIDIFKFIPPLKHINTNENQDSSAVILDDIIGGIYTYIIILIILGFYDINFLLSSILILLTPMIANMSPTLLKSKYLNTPINEKIFGKNKTWRGFIGAIIIGTIFFLVLTKINIIKIEYDIYYVLIIGFLFSFGAIVGDLIKSFFKRRKNIKSGEGWVPFDQIDYVLGMILLTSFIYKYTYSRTIFLIVLGGAISALAHRIGYMMKVNKAKQ